MLHQLSEEKYSFIPQKDREFILAFDEEMNRLGYTSNDAIGLGFCWGRYMIIYSKKGVKAKKVAARIYIREDGIVLRLFLNRIDEHRGYIENADWFIKEPFINEHGACKHCKNDKDGKCKFRKTYTLFGCHIEKCNGMTFEFAQPELEKLPGYVSLLEEFI